MTSFTINSLSFSSAMRFSFRAAKFDFNTRQFHPSASVLILVDVKQLGHFIQICVLLSIFNDLHMV